MLEIIHIVWEQIKAISFIEWFGVITGALCVYLAAKQNILNWPISILSVASYIYIFFNAKLYGDTLLQFYFLITAIYGWYYWTSGNTQSSLKSEREITRLNSREIILIAILLVFFGFVAGYLLEIYTDSDVPYIDGYCTITSFIAQYLMTRKKIENWIIWVIVDIVYIPLYIHKNLYATAVLYFVFSIIAAQGYVEWRKSFINRGSTHE